MQYPITEILRVGTVVTKDPKNMRCRVLCSDTPTSPLITHWLPVLVTRAFGDTYYDLPDIGSKVLCAFLPNGMEAGFILGSYYPDDRSPCADEDMYQHRFFDGTYIEYNRKEHKLTASCVGDVDIVAQGDINIIGKNISICAEGNLDLQAGQKVNIQE